MTSQTGLKVFSGLNSQTYEHPFLLVMVIFPYTREGELKCDVLI